MCPFVLHGRKVFQTTHVVRVNNWISIFGWTIPLTASLTVYLHKYSSLKRWWWIWQSNQSKWRRWQRRKLEILLFFPFKILSYWIFSVSCKSLRFFFFLLFYCNILSLLPWLYLQQYRVFKGITDALLTHKKTTLYCLLRCHALAALHAFLKIRQSQDALWQVQ